MTSKRLDVFTCSAMICLLNSACSHIVVWLVQWLSVVYMNCLLRASGWGLGPDPSTAMRPQKNDSTTFPFAVLKQNMAWMVDHMAVLQKCICQQTNKYIVMQYQSIPDASISGSCSCATQSTMPDCLHGRPHSLAQHAAVSLLTDSKVLDSCLSDAFQQVWNQSQAHQRR